MRMKSHVQMEQTTSGLYKLLFRYYRAGYRINYRFTKQQFYPSHKQTYIHEHTDKQRHEGSIYSIG